MEKHLSPLVFQTASNASDSPIRRFLRHFDWILFVDVLLLCLIGMTMVYSSALRFDKPELYFGKQFLAFSIGMTFLFIFATVNYQILGQYPKALFFLSISLLVWVLIPALGGVSHRGTRAWISLGPFVFQPSEAAKLITILLIGIWCDRNSREMHHLKSLVAPFMIVLCHMALILLQPDFGSTLVYFPVLLAMLYVAGASFLHLFVILFFWLVAGSVVLCSVGLSLVPDFLETHPFWSFVHNGTRVGKEFMMIQGLLAAAMTVAWWMFREFRLRIPGVFFLGLFLIAMAAWTSSSLFLNSLKEYQVKRLNVFFSPKLDPMGAGYHVIQSEVALGSGRIFGKGLFSSTQGRLGFLPEQHTDFIFSVLGEELGFVVSGFVLLLYIVLLWRTIAIAGDARDRFGSTVAVGIGCMFAFYGFLNLAMVMGMAPVTGLPLPFLSYGGSSMVCSLVAVGFLLSIHERRYTH